MSGTPFNPGDIIRYGKDNGIYIRAIDRSWYAVNIGHTGHHAPSGCSTDRNDHDFQQSIRRGYATVIYRSPGHYGDSAITQDVS